MKNIVLAIAALAVLGFGNGAIAATVPLKSDIAATTSASVKAPKECRKGKACGDTCIAKKAVCNIGSDEDNSATSANSKPTMDTTEAEKPKGSNDNVGGHPNCKKGKPCGHSCIAMDKVCHK